ncbi:MAG TPA: cupin domain-containing protein [Chitinophagaceae bacterium]|nr:cupin domain-containing protein [Chitinophagaceae bacterium]
MKPLKSKSYFFVLISILFLIACNESATTSEKNDMDTTTAVTRGDTSSMPAYDPAMDPLTVEAPFARKLGDTLDIKMYEVTLKPGDSVALHTHPDHTLYVVQGGKIIITPQGGQGQEMDVQAGMGMILPAQTHSGKNIGKTTVKLLVSDIYRPRAK